MDAVEFLKTKNRICRFYEDDPDDCFKCPIGSEDGECQAGVAANQKITEEELISIVQKWAKEHPVKTRQSEFLKMFPNTPKYNDFLDICPAHIGEIPNDACKQKSNCIICKKDFWLAALPEDKG